MADINISKKNKKKAGKGKAGRSDDVDAIRSMQAEYLSADGEADGEKPKKNYKKLALLMVALLAIGGAAGGAWLFLLQPSDVEAEVVEAAPEVIPKSYVEADPVHIAFKQDNGSPYRMIVYLLLEVEQRDGLVPRVKAALPRLQEAYWRILNRDPLPGAGQGAIELTVVKERVLAESVKILGPDIVHDVLIRKALVTRG